MTMSKYINHRFEAEMLADEHLKTQAQFEHNPPQFNQAIIDDVLQSLTLPQKELCAKYFYDAKGSALFEQICDLDEYYPFKSEMAMLPSVAQALSQKFSQDIDVIEFGAGASVKIKSLFNHIPQIKRYLPIDISGEHLRSAAKKLKAAYPSVEILPIEADFTQKVKLPTLTNHIKLGFFPGSTIGNFDKNLALDFLNQVRRSVGKGGYLLIGVDTKKSASVLHQAYNDKQGVTKAFNLNILNHLNQQAGANFELAQFEHYAFYNPVKSRIEMHLVSKKNQVVCIGGHNIHIAEGESIHTENSYKYNRQDFMHLSAKAGWKINQQWVAPNNQFSLYLLSTS
ncbi:L-histidine N(alpha)-methyltransferase [Catenovulum adriaticum]|uniref:L-histidine N(Alpha)-methyltransferase n=1 Tax=Catenovulum adriaticum TaxID=2984846 RepID=A0ABY7AIX0_9ALTE|nr:L-histidine N(alpha)-methyltransferase [Catenovulum sp. TS8]WAJ69051.1 L-histidine N(alpha)-methyltransferase [Catenovulum sp. TS8]